MIKPAGLGITIGTISDGSMCSKCLKFKRFCSCKEEEKIKEE